MVEISSGLVQAYAEAETSELTVSEASSYGFHDCQNPIWRHRFTIDRRETALEMIVTSGGSDCRQRPFTTRSAFVVTECGDLVVKHTGDYDSFFSRMDRGGRQRLTLLTGDPRGRGVLVMRDGQVALKLGDSLTDLIDLAPNDSGG